MDRKLVWLHLSDIHFLDKKEWRDNSVLRKLQDDVTSLLAVDLQIDMVFCTGDIGFGETSPEPLAAQYATAKAFFDRILEVCKLPVERFFLVPGNHDIDRNRVLPSQTEYFRSAKRTLDEINQMFHDGNGEVARAMERLKQYQEFVATHYKHIELDNKANFGSSINVNGVQLCIAGLNSAWTCVDNQDKNQIWLAGNAQLAACNKAISDKCGENKADLRIGLVHHPLCWLNPAEETQLRGRIENHFDFLLHGHAHHQWVKETRQPYHIIIAAGATAAKLPSEFGYNIVQLRPNNAQIHLRQYIRTGDGWGKQIIPGRAKDGIWDIPSPATFTVKDPATDIPTPIGLPIGSKQFNSLSERLQRGIETLQISNEIRGNISEVLDHPYFPDMMSISGDLVNNPIWQNEALYETRLEMIDKYRLDGPSSPQITHLDLMLLCCTDAQRIGLIYTYYSSDDWGYLIPNRKRLPKENLNHRQEINAAELAKYLPVHAEHIYVKPLADAYAISAKKHAEHQDLTIYIYEFCSVEIADKSFTFPRKETRPPPKKEHKEYWCRLRTLRSNETSKLRNGDVIRAITDLFKDNLSGLPTLRT